MLGVVDGLSATQLAFGHDPGPDSGSFELSSCGHIMALVNISCYVSLDGCCLVIAPSLAALRVGKVVSHNGHPSNITSKFS